MHTHTHTTNSCLLTVFWCKDPADDGGWSQADCPNTDRTIVCRVGPEACDDDRRLRGGNVSGLSGKDGYEGDQVITQYSILLLWIRWTPCQVNGPWINSSDNEIGWRAARNCSKDNGTKVANTP